MSYVHVVLLQLQILQHDDEYDENDGHDDETHLFIVVPVVSIRWEKKKNADVAQLKFYSVYREVRSIDMIDVIHNNCKLGSEIAKVSKTKVKTTEK